MAVIEEGIQRHNGHYVIPLPFRKSQLTMPNNRDQVLKRAMWQRKKMLRDENYRNDYVHFVNEMIAKGHARKVPEDRLEANQGKVRYLAHHGIYHGTTMHPGAWMDSLSLQGRVGYKFQDFCGNQRVSGLINRLR